MLISPNPADFAYMSLDLTNIEQLLTGNEALLRSSSFYGALILFGIAEELLPRRSIQLPMKLRWTANFGFMLINILLLRALLPIAAVELAFSLQARQWGLFNTYAYQGITALLLGVILLDCARYLLHRLSHAVPLLWRLHRVHHTDLDFDISTSVRHHPFEFMIATLFDFAVIGLFGLPPAAVILSAIISPAIDLFNHSNIHIPKWLDRIIRWLLVTPDMHRVHHSSYQAETDSNFSGLLSCWDHLFRTYRAQPRLGHGKMTIGLERWQSTTEQSLFRLLINPLSLKTLD